MVTYHVITGQVDMEKLKDDEEAANDIAEEDAAERAARVPEPVMKRTASDPNYPGMELRTPQGTPVWTTVDAKTLDCGGIPTTPELYRTEKEKELAEKMATLRARYTSLGAEIPEWMNQA
jgi:hypothetical protein